MSTSLSLPLSQAQERKMHKLGTGIDAGKHEVGFFSKNLAFLQ
jgi:hypothetical protein